MQRMKFGRIEFGSIGVVLAALVGGCAGNAPPSAAPAPVAASPNCHLQDGGAPGRTSTPHTRARLGCGTIGTPVDAVVAQMGKPDKAQVATDGAMTMVWVRSQYDRGVGTMSCNETVTAKGGTVVTYRQDGGGC